MGNSVKFVRGREVVDTLRGPDSFRDAEPLGITTGMTPGILDYSLFKTWP